jgi:hypothetical protein
MERAFNGDLCVQSDIKRFIGLLNIEHGIETGTFRAETTLFLVNLLKSVKTIEINRKRLAQCKRKLRTVSNVELFRGNSGQILESVVQNIPKDNLVLFYLDAHWETYWPLLDELKTIAKHFNNKAFIVIDDFQVPHKSLGYDRYGSLSNNLDYVKKDLDLCGDMFIFFNDHTNNNNGRGKLYALPQEYADKILPCLEFVNGYYYSNMKL